MRYTYIFENDIDRNTVQTLIDDIHGYDEVDLFFSTYGGETFPINSLLHYLNSRCENINIHLTSEICSAGTLILTDFKGKVIIEENLRFIMFHMFDYKSYNLRKDAVKDDILIKDIKNTNIEYSKKLLKLGLTKKEVKKFIKGKDVFLYRKDFNRLNLNNN